MKENFVFEHKGESTTTQINLNSNKQPEEIFKTKVSQLVKFIYWLDINKDDLESIGVYMEPLLKMSFYFFKF